MKRNFLHLISFMVPAACMLLLTGCGDGTPEKAISRAVALASKGEWQKAAKIADRTAKKNPELAAAHILRSVTSEQCGDLDAALDAAGRAVKLEPENFIAQYTLGRLYAGDPARSSEAQQVLRKALSLRRDSQEVKILLCNVAMEANFPNSLSYLGMLSGIPGMTTSAEYWNQYGVGYVRRGDFKTASKFFIMAIRHGGKQPEIVLNAARFYDGCMRNRKNAVTLYRSYLKIVRDDAAGKAEAAARLSILDPR